MKNRKIGKFFYRNPGLVSLFTQEALVENTLPIEVFLSYAREDQDLAQELEKHLSILKWQGLVNFWYDGMIIGGSDWLTEINRHLNTAQIILLLVSPDFIASDFAYSTELKRALERQSAGEARVIPIIARPTLWKNTPLGRLQAIPKDGKPMTEWASRDLAFLDVTMRIEQVVKDMTNNPPASLRLTAANHSISELDASNQYRFEELADDLRKSYSYIRGYEDILRLADDPREKAQAQRSISRQSILAKYYLNEYQELARQLGVRVPPDIIQISAYIGDPDTRAVS